MPQTPPETPPAPALRLEEYETDHWEEQQAKNEKVLNWKKGWIDEDVETIVNGM